MPDVRVLLGVAVVLDVRVLLVVPEVRVPGVAVEPEVLVLLVVLGVAVVLDVRVLLVVLEVRAPLCSTTLRSCAALRTAVPLLPAERVRRSNELSG